MTSYASARPGCCAVLVGSGLGWLCTSPTHMHTRTTPHAQIDTDYNERMTALLGASVHRLKALTAIPHPAHLLQIHPHTLLQHSLGILPEKPTRPSRARLRERKTFDAMPDPEDVGGVERDHIGCAPDERELLLRRLDHDRVRSQDESRHGRRSGREIVCGGRRLVDTVPVQYGRAFKVAVVRA